MKTSTQLNSIRFQPNTETPQEFVNKFDELVRKCANYNLDTSPNTIRYAFLRAVEKACPHILAYNTSFTSTPEKGATLPGLKSFFLGETYHLKKGGESGAINLVGRANEHLV